MPREKLLADIAAGLRALADNIQALSACESRTINKEETHPKSTAEIVQQSNETQEVAVQKSTPKSVDPQPLPTTEPEPVKLETVRAVLAEKSRDGHTVKIRELLEKHGASKLSGIDPKEYPALLAEAEALT